MGRLTRTLYGGENAPLATPQRVFFHTFLKTIFLYYSHPSFACHQLQVFVCSLKGHISRTSRFGISSTFISFYFPIYENISSWISENVAAKYTSCLKQLLSAKKISKVPNIKTLKLLFSSFLDAKNLPFCPFSLK